MADDDIDENPGDDWLPTPVDADGLPVSRDPSDITEPPNPYDAAILGTSPVDSAGLPISTPSTPNNPEPPAPMKPEEGLEGEDPEEEDEDPEEKKPPVQNLVRQTEVKLPGTKGSMVVDSIGDYLEDADWNAIDKAAREAAELARPKSGDPEPDGDSGEEPPPPPEPPAGAPEPPAGDMGDPGAGEEPAKVVPPPDVQDLLDDAVVTTSTSGATTSTHTSSPWDLHPPLGEDATANHLASQQEYKFPAPTSKSIQGVDSNASEASLELATDSVKTATAAVVQILDAFAQVMNVHARSIAQLEDQLDMDGERDVS